MLNFMLIPITLFVCLLLFIIIILSKKKHSIKADTDDPLETRTPSEFLPTEKIETEHLQPEELEEDLLPPTEKYNTNQFNYLLNIAITSVLLKNDASVSVVQEALNTGYHQAAKFLEHMEVAGIIGKLDPPSSRKIFLHPVLYRAIIREKLLSYQTLNISTIVSMLAEDVKVVLNKNRLEIEIVDLMEGSEFEVWCAELLKRLNYSDIEVTKHSGDQGVDILAQKEDIRFAFQCKCYSNDLGNSPVQEVYAGKRLYHCHIGIVITNRYFTSGAKELAEATNIILWDRDKLLTLIERAAQ